MTQMTQMKQIDTGLICENPVFLRPLRNRGVYSLLLSKGFHFLAAFENTL